MRKISEWLAALRSPLTKGPVLETRKIVVSDVGFEVRSEDIVELTVKWASVHHIDTFKRDFLTTDLICFRFYQEEGELPVEVNEEMEGIGPLLDALPIHFEGFDQAWWDKVAKPAFATNLTELWSRRA